MRLLAKLVIIAKQIRTSLASLTVREAHQSFRFPVLSVLDKIVPWMQPSRILGEIY